ncbi:hypothetical protein Tco_0996521 [Tanacetum coccineum]
MIRNKDDKLDRFLVSESVISGSPNIKAVTLERFLSDHRPILLKENVAGMKSCQFPLTILPSNPKIDNLESKERAQKAKIKWAVEGDENSVIFFMAKFGLGINGKNGFNVVVILERSIIIKEFEDVYQEWKMKNVIDWERRLHTVNQSVLVTMPIFHTMSMFKVLLQVSSILESLQVNSFNGHESSVKKLRGFNGRRLLLLKDNVV